MSMPRTDSERDQEESTGTPPSDELLLQFLHERDADCPVCGYNLRNLTSPRCPECGREIVLTLGAAEPYLRPWLTAMVAMCACAGVGALFVLAIIMDGMPPTRFWQLSVLLFILSIPAAVALVVGHRRYRRMDDASQRWLAVISVAYALITFFLLILAVGRY